MISLESEIMSNSYDPPGLLDGLGSGCRADAGPATSPSYIEGRGTASKDGGVKPSCGFGTLLVCRRTELGRRVDKQARTPLCVGKA